MAVKSLVQGLAKIDSDYVNAVNALGEIALATIRGNRLVEAGGQLAATRVIPLVVSQSRIEAVESLAAEYRSATGRAPIEVKPLRPMRAGLITTGGEVHSGRIQDRFGPAVRAKLEALGSAVAEQSILPDDKDAIARKILEYKNKEYDMILLTGGMSVDPDDRTPGAISSAGTDIVSYGTPMLPGSMLLIGYLGDTPVLGLPGCVMHDPYTSFDVLLPRILAGEKIVKEDIAAMGYGGLYGC